MPVNPPKTTTPAQKAQRTLTRAVADAWFMFAVGLIIGLFLGRI